MAENYVDAFQGELDAHYSREDGTEVNLMIDELEEHRNERYVVYENGRAVGSLENIGQTENWVFKISQSGTELARIALPKNSPERYCAKPRNKAS